MNMPDFYVLINSIFHCPVSVFKLQIKRYRVKITTNIFRLYRINFYKESLSNKLSGFLSVLEPLHTIIPIGLTLFIHLIKADKTLFSFSRSFNPEYGIKTSGAPNT